MVAAHEAAEDGCALAAPTALCVACALASLASQTQRLTSATSENVRLGPDKVSATKSSACSTRANEPLGWTKKGAVPLPRSSRHGRG
jgi:hypothetical protein